MAAFRAELQKAHHRHDLALCLLIPGIVVLWVGGLAPADPEALANGYSALLYSCLLYTSSVYSGRKQKNTRVPTLGTLVQYITSPCPVAAGCGALWASSRLSTPVHKKCIFSRKKFVQPVRSVLVRTRTAHRDKLRRVIVYISGFRTPYEPYRLFELRTRFFQMRTEQSSSHCANSVSYTHLDVYKRQR